MSNDSAGSGTLVRAILERPNVRPRTHKYDGNGPRRCEIDHGGHSLDIDPLGFKTIELTQLVTKDLVEQVRAVLHDQAMRHDWAKTNYALGVKCCSFAVARRKLAARLAHLFGEGI